LLALFQEGSFPFKILGSVDIFHPEMRRPFAGLLSQFHISEQVFHPDDIPPMKTGTGKQVSWVSQH
jgi:hypothetical protein